MSPHRRFERKECRKQVDRDSENLTEQLLNLKDTFTQVLNSVCLAIEKDCGDIGNDEKAKELAKIKQKYTNLREEVCRIISDFTMASPASKEETAAVQEGLNQCMSYLSRVHNSMESILRKYEQKVENPCCEKEDPHLHKVIDGNHVIIQLKKGTQSEMDYVSRLMNNMKSLPEEKRKKVFNKICQLPDSEEEFGAGDDKRRHAPVAEPVIRNTSVHRRVHQEQQIATENEPNLFFGKTNNTNFSSITSCKPESATRKKKPSKQELCQNWYFPEKIMDNLLAGYSWSKEMMKNELAKQETNDKKEIFSEKNVNTILQKKSVIGKRTYQNKREHGPFIEELPATPHVYDSKGNPLTDSKGNPLRNISGEFLVKFHKMKPATTLNGEPVFDNNCLPYVITLDKPLYNVKGEPLRLYNQDGIPLTDENGSALKLVTGKFSVLLDQYNRLVSDACGHPIFDSNGNQITSQISGTTEKQPSSAQLTTASEQPILYNEKGFLLTKCNGIPLKDSNGKPLVIKNKTSGAVMDHVGRPVYDSQGNAYTGPIGRKKLVVYDCHKYPLTNREGDVLYNLEGKEMVTFDNDGKPDKDCMNRLVYDAAGNPSNTPHFYPYVHHTRKQKRKDVNFVQIYDFRGYPLLDCDGSPLATSDDKVLIVYNNKGEIVHDLNGYPVFDKSGVPLTKINGSWITNHGLPYRVFDDNGYPLTGDKGEDLFDINGNNLIKVDQIGRPVETATGVVVYDINGIPATHSEFNPSQGPPNNTLTRKVYMYNRPMKIYNTKGMPLTDAGGAARQDARGRDLIHFDEQGIPIKDANGNRIFDEFRMPLNCCPNEAIISMSGKPMRIYDKIGRPLTDINGIPLNLANGLCTIKFDNAGRPIADFRNNDLYDFTGRILQEPLANPEFCKDEDQVKLLKKNSKPVRVYNREGMPLTDVNGIMLVNSDGTHLQLNNDGYPLSDWNGDPVYSEIGQPFTSTSISRDVSREEPERCTDPFGRPLRDACGEAQFDKFGRPQFDLYRRRLYNEEGRPVANAFGKYLVTNLPEPKEINLGFDPVILNSRANSSMTLLTDLIGGPLFDYVGIPLYNQNGKPLIDIYGRPLYDDNGLPLCDDSGNPVSELVRQNGIPVQVKDVYKPIEVSKEVADLIDDTVIRSTRTEHSPNIPGIWILPSSIDNQVSNTHPEKKLYWALLRMTTFDDGKKSFEILEAKPYHSG